MQKRQPKAKKSLAFCPYHKNNKNFWQFQFGFEVLFCPQAGGLSF
jgi:hypothetical protein